jgi:hypothetical protein
MWVATILFLTMRSTWIYSRYYLDFAYTLPCPGTFYKISSLDTDSWNFIKINHHIWFFLTGIRAMKQTVEIEIICEISQSWTKIKARFKAHIEIKWNKMRNHIMLSLLYEIADGILFHLYFYHLNYARNQRP